MILLVVWILGSIIAILSSVKREKALKAIGLNIRRVRDDMQLSQEKAAELCGMHRTFYAGIERGERNATIITLLRITRAFKVSLDELTHGVK